MSIAIGVLDGALAAQSLQGLKNCQSKMFSDKLVFGAHTASLGLEFKQVYDKFQEGKYMEGLKQLKSVTKVLKAIVNVCDKDTTDGKKLLQIIDKLENAGAWGLVMNGGKNAFLNKGRIWGEA